MALDLPGSISRLSTKRGVLQWAGGRVGCICADAALLSHDKQYRVTTADIVLHFENSRDELKERK